jgi:hypothetical protein
MNHRLKVVKVDFDIVTREEVIEFTAHVDPTILKHYVWDNA